MIIHLGTVVISEFGQLDERGNVVKRTPVRAELAAVGPAELAEVGTQMLLARQRLEAEDAVAHPSAPPANGQSQEKADAGLPGAV